MRMLFCCLPAYGHAYPLIPLALACRDARHEVWFATGPSFQRPLADLALPTISAGITIRDAYTVANGRAYSFAATGTPPPPELVAAAFADVLPRALAADLAPVLPELRPDLVVYEASALGAYFAARHAGIPRVCHGIGRGIDRGREMINTRLATLAAEFDLPAPPANGRGGDPYLDIYPASMQAPALLAHPGRIPLRPSPVPVPGQLPGWLTDRTADDRPLVYLTLGTGFGTVPVFRHAIAGLAQLPCDVVVAIGATLDPAMLGELPAAVRVEPWVPQAAVLARSALVVHHGGSGTTLGVLAAGLPQLVLPQGADQFSNAEAVAATGAGEQLLPGAVSADAVAEAARRLLVDARYRTRSQRVAAEIAEMPSPADTVPVLVAEVARNQT